MLERYRVLIYGMLAVAILAGVVTLVTNRPAPVEITVNPPLPTQTPAPIRVYVTGAVVRSQHTVELPFGSRVEDAVNAVGGFTADADRTSINLARILQDGEHLHVLGTAELASSVESISTPQALTKPLVNVNTASAAELQALPGCGPAMANAIVAYRVQNGSFRSMDDLDKVDGIGPKTLEAWQGLILFG